MAVAVSEKFAAMQEAELAWWQRFLSSPCARERMYALYGARYLAYFYPEFTEDGRLVEFGCGPLPVARLTRAREAWLVDTLGDRYRQEGLTDENIWRRPPPGARDLDLALLLNVLDHTDEPDGLVRDAWGVLRPGGRVLVFVHLGQEDDKHRLIERMEPVAWLHDAGFTIEKLWHAPANVFDPPAFVAVARRG